MKRKKWAQGRREKTWRLFFDRYYTDVDGKWYSRRVDNPRVEVPLKHVLIDAIEFGYKLAKDGHDAKFEEMDKVRGSGRFTADPTEKSTIRKAEYV